MSTNTLRNLVGLLLATLTIALMSLAYSEGIRLGEQRQMEETR